MNQRECSFFLGANSKDGFVSFFSSMAEEEPGRVVHIIKSGPGCGKATLMARTAKAVARDGDMLEQIFCSSDPSSLDGVIFHGGSVALWDGTAPHVEEPPFPGACGEYITTPPFINVEGLQKKRDQLFALAGASREHYKRAYSMISASNAIDGRIISMLSPFFAATRLGKRAAGIIAREVPKASGYGIIRKRFLDGITPDGLIRFDSTIAALAKKVYCIEDSWGFAPCILEPLLHGICARGHDVYACYSPKDTSQLMHIIVPTLSLAFVTCEKADEGSYYRKVRCDAYLSETAHELKGKARLLRRISVAMIEDAVSEIAQAHKLHDKIEELYRPHIDFAGLDRLTAELADRLR